MNTEAVLNTTTTHTAPTPSASSERSSGALEHDLPRTRSDRVQSTEQRRARLIDVLRDFRVAMLVTRERSGGVRVRPMTVADLREDGDLVFATSLHSELVHEIERDSEVTVVFQGQDTYASVSGRASISLDAATIDSLWMDSWKTFFPLGRLDPELCLVRVESRGGEYWDLSGTHGIRYLLNALRVFVAGESQPGIHDDRSNARVGF